VKPSSSASAVKEEWTVYPECEGTSFPQNVGNCSSSSHPNNPKDLNLDAKNVHLWLREDPHV
jgi:hypothetical protein